jgi:predicted nucleic acid-binding protein
VSYLIDTNVLSELRKGQRCNAHVLAWFAQVPDRELYLSVLVIGEIRRGIERIRLRDAPSAASIDGWLARVITGYSDRILFVSREIAEEWGRMNAVRPLSTIDSLLAATAKIHGLTLVTRNIADIAMTGVAYLNPFESPV